MSTMWLVKTVIVGASVRPLNFTVRPLEGPMRRQLFFAVACLGLLCAYGYALVWVFGYEAALPMPRTWTWFWMILTDTMTLILVSALRWLL